jgi:hypothetical protein
MPRGKSARWAALALGLGALLAVWFYPTEEKRVKEAVEAIVSAANGTPGELAQALDQHAVANVSLSVTELAEPVEGRAAIVEAVSRANRLGQKLHFRIESSEVSIEGSHARVTADLITMLQPEVPELRRPRHSVALFEKRAGHYRLVSAEIGTERLDQPEARP